jgi:23S rRNA (uracil1939-C5)-methyltransferase
MKTTIHKGIVEKLTFGGMGLIRTAQGVVFISDVLPGEEVLFEISGSVQGVQMATVCGFEKKSEHRREPFCKYYDECGGCNWQFIAPSMQIEYKKEIFIDCLKRIGKVTTLPSIECFSSDDKEYRIRAQFKIDADGKIGFFKKKTNDIVEIDNCPLLCKQGNRVLGELIKNRSLLADLHTKSIKVIAGDSLVASSPVIPFFTESETVITLNSHSFKVYGDSFFQSNKHLYGQMGKWARTVIHGGYCVDLYGGTGFLSVMMGDLFSKGMLIESVESQVRLARENFALNKMNHFKAQIADAEKLQQFVNTSPDFLIVDPPRPGLTKQVRDAIIKMRPAQIFYLSCNPSTQARDVGFLISNGIYSIIKAALFDCYPHTYHLETGLVLKRN